MPYQKKEKKERPGTKQTFDNPYFPSMKAAAHALKIDIAILRAARSQDCPAFRSGGNVHRAQIIEWLAENAGKTESNATPQIDLQAPAEDESYTVTDEVGGVGQTLKSLQAYERKLKQRVDAIERDTTIHPLTKADRLKGAQEAWLKVVGALLKYDLSVSAAKRDSGELIPLADAVKGIQALLAWHTVATSDALRNVIPECEGENKFKIAEKLDAALRSAIYRNFKSGIKIGKIPEWMGKEASDFVKKEKPISLDKPMTMEDF